MSPNAWDIRISLNGEPLDAAGFAPGDDEFVVHGPPRALPALEPSFVWLEVEANDERDGGVVSLAVHEARLLAALKLTSREDLLGATVTGTTPTGRTASGTVRAVVAP